MLAEDLEPFGKIPRAMRWTGGVWGRLRLLDQTRLPGETVEIEIPDLDAAIDAIRRLAVRGAPALGITAAYAAVVGIREGRPRDPGALRALFEEVRARLVDARPTAVNLAWSLGRMATRLARAEGPVDALLEELLDEARRIHEEDRRACECIGRHGLELIPRDGVVLTHCHAGALATGGRGTALAPIHAAHAAGRGVRVFVDETRPLLQGARLTAWELRQAGVPATLLCDGAAAHVLRTRRVDLVLVGADRIAANGDVANKIGTYGLALAARAHGVPFWVAAPRSTIDLECRDGDAIPIEERAAEEVTTLGGVRIAPEGCPVLAPAFDVTPAALVEGLITEAGLLRRPDAAGLRSLVRRLPPEGPTDAERAP